MGHGKKLSAFLGAILFPSAVLAYQALQKVSDTDRKLSGLSDNLTINGEGQWLVG